MLATAVGLTSCLKDDDDSDVTLHDDMAVTSFALSAVNRTVHTTSSTGADSTYKVTMTSALPVFTIDQYNYRIYNTEPLQSGCDLKHVLAAIGSKNSGSIFIKSMVSDSLFYYNSTDSIDFSQTRELRVYAQDGSGYRPYQITVNMKASSDDGLSWEEVGANDSSIPAALYQDFVLTAGEGQSFKLSKDNGQTWTDEPIGEGEDASLLPVASTAWVTFPYSANANTTCELMAGTIGSSDKACTLWRKLIDNNAGAEAAKWVNMPVSPSNNHYLPAMTQLSLVWFNKALYVIGNDGTIYKTRDQGITWNTTTGITLPAAMESNNVKATTDTDGNLWLRNLDSGRIWKGSVK